jgi:ferric-chelate reductase (NADPH)
MSKLKKSILGWLGEKFCEPARVSKVEVISEHFRLIHVDSPSFAKLKWKAGDKIQINVGDWNMRTYTPIAHQPLLSRIQLLVFIHGDGPGATWAKNLKRGDLCEVFGPRSSLSVSSYEIPRVLFGDETSFAVAAGLKNYYGNTIDVSWVFEVASIEESKQVCERFGIARDTVFIEKQNNGSHFSQVMTSLRSRLDGSNRTELFLTGNARSIQSVRNAIRDLNHSNTVLFPKAYWSPGKVGLD